MNEWISEWIYRIRDRVWGRSRLSNTTKSRVYNSCVLSSLLDASETWALLKADIEKLEAFHMTNQRRILGILWYEFVTNVEVATLPQLPPINEAISRKRHSLWRRQAYGSGCSCPPSPTSLSHVTTGLRTVWYLEETTRSSAKMLGGAGHHEHRTFSFWCLVCCDGSVSKEGATTRRRSSVERERERERESND